MAEPEPGSVKWFNNTKGFGFIVRENGGDIFVHYSSISSKGFRTLQEGDKVEFTVVEAEKGLQAQDITILS